VSEWRGKDLNPTLDPLIMQNIPALGLEEEKEEKGIPPRLGEEKKFFVGTGPYVEPNHATVFNALDWHFGNKEFGISLQQGRSERREEGFRGKVGGRKNPSDLNLVRQDGLAIKGRDFKLRDQGGRFRKIWTEGKKGKICMDGVSQLDG